MSDTAPRTNHSRSPAVSAPPSERRTDRAIAVWFLVTIVALYGVIGWAMYAVIGAVF